MAYDVPPGANPLRECKDWFIRFYNTSVYAHHVPLRGRTAVRESKAHNLFPLPTPPLLLKGILLCLLVSFIVSYARGSRQRLPPQPKGLPIIGNFFQLADRSWLYSRDCKESFGEYQALT